MSSAQTESGQTFFDIITHPDCENYCWMGIEPGVTAFEDIEDILIANGMDFYYSLAMFEMPVVCNIDMFQQLPTL